MEQQMEYAVNLEKINGIIQLRKQELQKLDDLIKSRFIEMFGDTRSRVSESFVQSGPRKLLNKK